MIERMKPGWVISLVHAEEMILFDVLINKLRADKDIQ